MKISTLMLALTMVLGLQSCLKDSCKRMVTYLRYTPIVQDPADYRVPATVEGPRALSKPGKLFVAGDFVFINEKNEGIHVIDNSDPANPQNVSFIKIPGNIDLFFKNGYLYADNYTDLISIRFTDANTIQMADREMDVFPTYGTDEFGRPIVGYTEEIVTEEMECQDAFGGPVWMDGGVFVQPVGGVVTNAAEAAAATGGTSAPGSMTRFMINGDALYALNQWTMLVLNISDPNNMTLSNPIATNSSAETLFASGDHLFMGTTTGMQIYSITDPFAPMYISTYNHMTSCDPVVVQGNRAYVTLRDGTECQGFSNQLEVLDISDVYNPILLKTYPMTNPHGLSVEDNHLWLCDGADGLKAFDISDEMAIDQHLLDHEKGFATYDVIKLFGQNTLLVIGQGGFYQFDCSNNSDLRQISKIAVQ